MMNAGGSASALEKRPDDARWMDHTYLSHVVSRVQRISRQTRLALAIGALAAVVTVTLAALLASSLSLGTTLERADFATEKEALNFVSSHLPARLPDAAKIQKLRYERFTDWHLEASVQLGSEAAALAFMGQARAARVLDEAYCGPEEPGGVSFSLPQWQACGRLTPQGSAGELHLTCNTR